MGVLCPSRLVCDVFVHSYISADSITACRRRQRPAVEVITGRRGKRIVDNGVTLAGGDIIHFRSAGNGIAVSRTGIVGNGVVPHAVNGIFIRAAFEIYRGIRDFGAVRHGPAEEIVTGFAD